MSTFFLQISICTQMQSDSDDMSTNLILLKSELLALSDSDAMVGLSKVQRSCYFLLILSAPCTFYLKTTDHYILATRRPQITA